MADKATVKPNARILITPELLQQMLMLTPDVLPICVTVEGASPQRAMDAFIAAAGLPALKTPCVECQVCDSTLPDVPVGEPLPYIVPVFVRDEEGNNELERIDRFPVRS